MFNTQSSNNPYDLSNPINNFYQGYQMAFIPQQMREEQQMNALKKAYMQQQMQSEPEMNAEKLKQLQLQNQGLASSNSLDQFKIQQAQQEAARKAAFMKMLQGGGSSDQPSQPVSSSTMGNTNPNSNIASPSPNAMSQPTNNSQPSALDQAWDNPYLRAQYSDLFNEYGVQGKQQVFNNPNTGEAVIAKTSPSGQVSFQAVKVGESPYQRSFDSERGKGEAQQYNQAMTQNAQLSQSSIAIDDLINKMQSPELKNIIGPTGQSTLTTYFGTPEQKRLLGDIRAQSGTIFTDLMNSMRGTGAVSDRESSQFLKMKPNETDYPETMYGKLQAIKVSKDLISQRNQAYLNNMDNGMNSSQARLMAEKQVPIDPIMKQVDSLLSPKVNVTKNGQIYSIDKSLATSENLKAGGYSLVK